MGKSTTYHCNLTAKSFPFCGEDLAATVFVNQGQEQNRNLITGFDGKDVADSFGLSQVWFMQNVLPITRGYSSCYFAKQINSWAESPDWQDLSSYGPTIGKIDRVFLLREEFDNLALFAPAHGANLIFDPSVGHWKANSMEGEIESTVTHTYLKGTSYIAIAYYGVYVYNFLTKTLDKKTLLGINDDSIQGVASALNYLLVWTKDTLYWSSVVDPTDFVPSLITGANSTKILATHGAITCILPIADGFICYTTVNAVAATYSGDSNSPWIFREIPGSAGVAKEDHVTYGSAQDSHVAWTTTGMQAVSLREATPIWPELSDSLAREIYTDISSDMGMNSRPGDFTSLDNAIARRPKVLAPRKVDTEGPFEIKVTSALSRYICVSIKPTVYTMEQSVISPLKWSYTKVPTENQPSNYKIAYVFDVLTNRWGRLDAPHTNFMEFLSPQLLNSTTYQDLLDQDVSYQGLMTQADQDDYVAAGGAVLANMEEGVALGEDFSLTYADLGANIDLSTSTFGDNFGLVNAEGEIYTIRLYKGKEYLAELSSENSYLTPALYGATPCIFHGKYKVVRDRTVLFHSLQATKVYPSLVNVYVLPHAPDGEVAAEEIKATALVGWDSYSLAAGNFDTLQEKYNHYPWMDYLGHPMGLQEVLNLEGIQGKYCARLAADSISVKFEGHFTLTDLSVTLEVGGRYQSRIPQVATSLPTTPSYLGYLVIYDEVGPL